MASIFKRGGKKGRGRPYYIEWTDHEGRRRQKCTRTTDKATAERIAAKYETEAAKRREGLIDVVQEGFAQQRKRPIAVHMDEYRNILAAKNRTPKHVEMTLARIQWVIRECGATNIRDLMPARVQPAIKTLHGAGKSLETCNSYIRAIKAFSRWLWKEKRAPDDALATLEHYQTSVESSRHERRAFSTDELVFLFSFVEKYTKPNHKMSGPDRAMLYRLAVGTGLRVNELRSLTPDSFDLNANPPTVTVEAAYSKHRHTDVQLIALQLTGLLKPWLKGRPKTKPVFPNMPGSMARTLRKDLQAARKAWIAKASNEREQAQRKRSQFLRYEDADCRIADFHALRHTYISGIVAGGASVKTAQTLARHSDPRLTIGRYSHTELHDLQGAVDNLPDFTSDTSTPAVMQATGTDPQTAEQSAASGAAHLQHFVRETVQNGAGGCDRETEKASAVGDSDTRPKVLPLTTLCDAVQGDAEAEGTGLEPAIPYGTPHFQ